MNSTGQVTRIRLSVLHCMFCIACLCLQREAPAITPPVEALQLGTPAGVAAPKEKQGGLNLFGYTVLPKLNFGLDVLYGQDQPQFQLGAPDNLDTLEENDDVSVLGKVKRRF